MKQLILLLCFAFSISIICAQTPNFLPPGLHKLSEEEMSGRDIMLDGSKAVYTIEGEKLDQLSLMSLLAGGEYTFDFYGDKSGEIQAMVLRNATDTEQDMILAKKKALPGRSDLLGSRLPLFSAWNMQGEEIHSETSTSEVWVINFWFIGCKPCVAEMPHLNALTREFAGKPVRFVAVTFDSKEDVSKFLEQHTFDYEIIPSGKKIIDQFEVEGFPTHIIADSGGFIRFATTGLFPGLKDILSTKIKEVL